MKALRLNEISRLERLRFGASARLQLHAHSWSMYPDKEPSKDKRPCFIVMSNQDILDQFVEYGANNMVVGSIPYEDW